MAAPVLQQMCGIWFGDIAEANIRAEFRQDLLIFLGNLNRSAKTSISATAVRRWFSTDEVRDPKRQMAMGFLYEYLLWKKDEKSSLGSEKDATLLLIEASLRRYVQEIRIGELDTPSHHKLSFQNIEVATIRPIVEASKNSSRLEQDDFFGGNKIPEDESYFVMYRYSTKYGAFLKTFIVIRPVRGSDGQYIFNHFVWSSSSRITVMHNVFRECEGMIVKFEKAYYFIGYNFMVPVNKRRSPAEYEIRRRSSRHKPNGMGIITVEYESLYSNPDLLSGLTMTLAAAGQPVVARVALLHIGTKNSLRVPIKDTEVIPDEIESESIKSDFEAMMKRLEEFCPPSAVFSPYVHNTRPRSGPGHEDRLDNMIKDIKNRINNLPAGREAKRMGNGAIETWGITGSRPRD